jgi:hypothetical protein
MPGMIEGLREACPVCGRVSGEHTMFEWSACMGTATTNLGYQEIPADAKAIADRLGLPEGTLAVDNVIVKATVIDATADGGLTIKMPAVLHEFSTSPDTGHVLARILYLGDVATIRAYGRLVRDTANGAANAAAKAAAA